MQKKQLLKQNDTLQSMNPNNPPPPPNDSQHYFLPE